MNEETSKKEFFDKNMHYYICSYGGSGAALLSEYLSHFGNTHIIYTRHPPQKLTLVNQNNNNWFGNIEINEHDLSKHKVIFIYKNPIHAIYNEFVTQYTYNKEHLEKISCDNNGNIRLLDVVRLKKDLYKINQFFHNYSSRNKRNYQIFCVKYEDMWLPKNIDYLNKLLIIPNMPSIYPTKEIEKIGYYDEQLTSIYRPLINKMKDMRYIEII